MIKREEHNVVMREKRLLMALGRFAKNLKTKLSLLPLPSGKNLAWSRRSSCIYPKNRENSQATICDVVINVYHDTLLLLSEETMTNALQGPGGRAMNDTSV